MPGREAGGGWCRASARLAQDAERDRHGPALAAVERRHRLQAELARSEAVAVEPPVEAQAVRADPVGVAERAHGNPAGAALELALVLALALGGRLDAALPAPDPGPGD